MSRQLRTTIPQRFQAAYQSIEQLALHDRYLAAFIFGSFARGEATNQSDLDVNVIVDEDNLCTNINHPVVGGVKFDLTFFSLKQLKERTAQEMERRQRIPMVAESLIVFDKTHELLHIQTQAQQVDPIGVRPDEQQFLQFMFFHANDKVQRHLEIDPMSAQLSMHVGLNDLLHYHYQLQQKWWISSKRLLSDLRTWDLPLAQLLEQFLAASDVHIKFTHWSAIIDHILEPLGGRQSIAENNCTCLTCQRDLAMILSAQES